MSLNVTFFLWYHYNAVNAKHPDSLLWEELSETAALFCCVHYGHAGEDELQGGGYPWPARKKAVAGRSNRRAEQTCVGSSISRVRLAGHLEPCSLHDLFADIWLCPMWTR